ncbi:MAG: hypothetical protein PVJ72_06500 [Gammaproteobacteria bacterium]|jgi:hypothetical protein
MRLLLVNVVGLLCWLQTSLVSANPYIVIDSFTRSESVPISDIVDDEWDSPIKNGDTAFSYNWAEIGATYKGFGLGYLSRYDYELKYSRDTAEFYHLVNNKKALPIGEQFNLLLIAKQIYSEGLRLSYQFQINKQLEFTIGGSYLKGLKLTEGKLSGAATAIAEKDYDFKADVNYFYSKDVLFKRKVNSPEGVGYSIDTQVNWNVLRDLSMRLQIVDLVGSIYWSDAPNTTAIATSDIKEYDEDGYVKYKPVLKGNRSYQDFTQKLDPRVNLQFNYAFNSSAEVVGRIYRYEPGTFYQLGGEYAFNPSDRVQILYMFDTNAVSLGYVSKYLEFGITSDSINVNKSYILAIKLNAHVDFF